MLVLIEDYWNRIQNFQVIKEYVLIDIFKDL